MECSLSLSGPVSYTWSKKDGKLPASARSDNVGIGMTLYGWPSSCRDQVSQRSFSLSEKTEEKLITPANHFPIYINNAFVISLCIVCFGGLGLYHGKDLAHCWYTVKPQIFFCSWYMIEPQICPVAGTW